MQKMHVAALVIILAGLGVVLNRTFRGEERPVETKAPVPAEETYLEKEQKRLNAIFREYAEEDVAAHREGVNVNLPPRVKAQYDAFEMREGVNDPRNLERSVGWGVGTYRGRKVEFFAYTVKDFAVELALSARLTDADLGRIRKMKDEEFFEGSVEAAIPDGKGGPHLPGTETWIRRYYPGEPPCVMPEMRPCYMGGLMETLLRDLRSAVPGLRLEVKGRFPWS